jgi:hypothetical protein
MKLHFVDQHKRSAQAAAGGGGKQEFTITVYTENQVGLLNRIAR